MYSWVWASTPGVTRRYTAWRTPGSRGDRREPARAPRSESTTIRPTPASTARVELGDRLVVAVEQQPLGREAGAQRDRQLAAGADVEAEPLLGDPAGDLGAQERLGGVVDGAALERLRARRGPGAEVVLVEHVRGGAELGGEVAHVDAAELERAVGRAAGASPARRPGRGRPRARAAGQRRGAHMRSGALTPSRARPFSSTVRVARQSSSRGAVGRRDLLVALRQHLAVVPEALGRLRDLLLQVAGDPVRLAQLGGRRDDRGELGQRQQQLGLARVGQQREVDVVDGRLGDAEVGGVAQHRGGPGGGVLDVEDRVVGGLARPQVEVDVDAWLSVLRAHQRVAAGVDPDGVDEVLERDDRAGALAHPERLAAAQQVDQLADEDLEVDPRGVAERGAHRHHPADVAGVVGAEHDEAAVEAALALVEVVGEVAGDVGRLRRRS